MSFNTIAGVIVGGAVLYLAGKTALRLTIRKAVRQTVRRMKEQQQADTARGVVA